MLYGSVTVFSDACTFEQLSDCLGTPSSGHNRGALRRDGTAYTYSKWQIELSSSGDGCIEDRLEAKLAEISEVYRELPDAEVRIDFWANLESSYDWPGLSLSLQFLELALKCQAEVDIDIAVY